MTSRRDTFYAERDMRSRQYGARDDALEHPVHIVVGADVATTRAGQIAALALINMVVRAYRRVHLDVPPVALLARSLVPAEDLRTAARATALAINPVLDLTTSEDVAPPSVPVSVGLGRHLPDGLDVHLGWVGGRGTLATDPRVNDTWDPNSVFGAAAAGVLGAAGLYRLVHGESIRPTRFNPIELTADHAAGTRDHAEPIDVGTALIIGAGAVSSGLAYWVRELGVAGEPWDFVDGDMAEVHNTNRCLVMTAAHAGWADGTPGGQPVSKAEATAWAIDGCHHPLWYEQWLPDHQARHDLVLCLANERGVRPFVTQRGEPLLLHATTSPHWTAELHRHVPGRDDCPACRLPDPNTAQPACATGPANPIRSDSPDAALPFLSAAAGLLLAAALTDLPRGVVCMDTCNHWQFDMTFADPLLRSQRWQPSDECTHQQPRSIRRAVQAASPRRWDRLDTDSAGDGS